VGRRPGGPGRTLREASGARHGGGLALPVQRGPGRAPGAGGPPGRRTHRLPLPPGRGRDPPARLPDPHPAEGPGPQPPGRRAPGDGAGGGRRRDGRAGGTGPRRRDPPGAGRRAGGPGWGSGGRRPLPSTWEATPRRRRGRTSSFPSPPSPSRRGPSPTTRAGCSASGPVSRVPGSARPAWLVLGTILARLTGGAAPTRADEAFLRIAGEATPAFQGLTYETLGTRGALVNDPVPLPGA
jgi:hypothetical protein